MRRWRRDPPLNTTGAPHAQLATVLIISQLAGSLLAYSSSALAFTYLLTYLGPTCFITTDINQNHFSLYKRCELLIIYLTECQSDG